MPDLRRTWRAGRDWLWPEKIGRGSVVEIFSKPDCHLCEVAKAHLLRLQKKWGFELREVNVAQDENLMMNYGSRIPLVLVNGRPACKYKIDEQALRQKLRSTGAQEGEE